METVLLAGRPVGRLGMSLAGLRTTGMWGEPAGREVAVEAVRRALELGAGVVEVPVPFGPYADLVRQAGPGEAFVAVRLTGAPGGLEVVRRRLGGRLPDLVLAEEDGAEEARRWGLPVGVVVRGGQRIRPQEWAAVRGPYPAPAGLVEDCERQGVPYLAPSPAVLGDGKLTVALPAPSGVTEIERLFGATTPTPRAAGPG